ncbi:KIN10 [Symbiodinium sp. CCMP2592]|nr:KIN10 [Symbiodinium sp. CCMP2592]
MASEQRLAGTLRVYFEDNTFRTLPLKPESTVQDVIESLCKRRASNGREADPERHELLLKAPGPGRTKLRERLLQREERPLQIQEKGGQSAFKFLFREIRQTGHDTLNVEDELTLPLANKDGRLRTGSLELDCDGAWQRCTVALDGESLWHSQVFQDDGAALGGGMARMPLRSAVGVVQGEDEEERVFQLLTRDGTLTWRARSTKARNGWLEELSARLKQVQDVELLTKAENLICEVEARRCDENLSKLEAFDTVEGLLAGGEARDLFLWFLRAQLEQFPSITDESLRSLAAEPSSEAVHFAEEMLPRFKEHPGIQSRLCRIAAGVPGNICWALQESTYFQCQCR